MGKLFSFDVLTENQKESEKISSKRNDKEIEECLKLDRLYWKQNGRHGLDDDLEKIDCEWYARVIKGAKYSRVGETFINEKKGIKCVMIHRPSLFNKEDKLPFHSDGNIITLNKKRPNRKNHTLLKRQSSSSVASSESNPAGSTNNNDTEINSILSASEIHRQALTVLPPCDISPLSEHRQIPIDQSDILNYDFTFNNARTKS